MYTHTVKLLKVSSWRIPLLFWTSHFTFLFSFLFPLLSPPQTHCEITLLAIHLVWILGVAFKEISLWFTSVKTTCKRKKGQFLVLFFNKICFACIPSPLGTLELYSCFLIYTQWRVSKAKEVSIDCCEKLVLCLLIFVYMPIGLRAMSLFKQIEIINK